MIKKFKSSLLSIAVLALMLFSCSSDESNEQVNPSSSSKEFSSSSVTVAPSSSSAEASSSSSAEASSSSPAGASSRSSAGASSSSSGATPYVPPSSPSITPSSSSAAPSSSSLAPSSSSSSSAPYVPYGTPKNVMDFTFDDIQYWVGTGTNKAMLIIQLNDGEDPAALAWGYKWNGTKYGYDMLNDIAKADKRLFYLKFQSGSMGYAIGGIGFDFSGSSNVKLNKGGTCVDPPLVMNPCFDSPPDPGACVAPVNGSIVTNDYDFDYWVLCPGVDMRWQKGWFEKYWSYWVTDNVDSRWEYSGLGASSRVLANNSVDAWYMDLYAFESEDLSTFWVCMMFGGDCDGRTFFGDITPVMPPSH